MSKLIGGGGQFGCDRIEHGPEGRLLTGTLQAEGKTAPQLEFPVMGTAGRLTAYGQLFNHDFSVA